MPQIVKKPQPKPAASVRDKLVWNAEAQIEACPYRMGKLTFKGAVVGEITLLRQGCSTVISVLRAAGIVVVEQGD